MKQTDPIDDFGFTFSDDTVSEAHLTTEKQNTDQSNKKLIALYNAIIPFLDNLCKNPEKSTIHWPDRVAKIEAYKKKLNQIVEGK